ncbi:MAG: ATP-dependent helicase, partial [Caldilineaceae bacterium]
MAEEFRLREEQERILEYHGGYMGISAVPGSGKTFTLSHLAAKLVNDLNRTSSLEEREVLVVTFTNNAVENFQNRIARVLHETSGLLPGVGYRVRTLHALAHDIVRERPALAGLNEEFAIIDDRTADDVIDEVVISYLRSHPDTFASYVGPDYRRSGNLDKWIQRDATEISKAAIRTIKDMGMDLHRLHENLRAQSGTWPLLELVLHVYADYQRSLEYRGAVDFDDLIVFALRVLESDNAFLARLQQRWPYVLEDEAQDSSLLQERLLRLLTAAHGNWVRVGDPNQAINTTFTSASTRYLTDFINSGTSISRELPVSGRSAQPIIDTANRLIAWSQGAKASGEVAYSLVLPLIEPTLPDDPQANPPADASSVFLYDPPNSPLSSSAEIDVITRSLQRWLPDNPCRTIAVLSPTQARTAHIADVLQKNGIAVDDSLMRSGSATRQATKALAVLLDYIARPENGSGLSVAWSEAWWPQKGIGLRAAKDDSDEPGTASPIYDSREAPTEVRTFGAALQQLRTPEEFLFPTQRDWLDVVAWIDEVDGFRELVELFRTDMQRWTQATILPVDELLLTIGNELFSEPAYLALTHHLAVLLAKLSRENSEWRLPELARELHHVAENRRRMPDFSSDSQGYEPKPGVVTVATMHGAKGLEWDRVYLTAVNSYSYPSGGDEEQYRGESFYVRDRLNLTAETLAQLGQLHMGTLDDYREGAASSDARQEIAAERLRLLYVGITRARRELIVTYNTGRNPDSNPLPP